ncbi:hypothetical protein N0V90_005806 [Kalmusia sp. IMI 367209]|nr:hypothetical protein N0V90_005806 [Kalmusia sp. IMI 367209]
MYTALRTGLRASYRRPPARLIHRRRYPSPHRTRSFHASRGLAQEPTPPADPDSKPVDNNVAEHKSDERAAAQAEPGDAQEDADLLAHKLQRSREMTRRYSSALRRSQRRNRAQDLPPVVVPDWFVNQCILVHDQAPPEIRQRRRKAFTLSLQRRNTDEVGSCSIPIHAPPAALQLLSDFIFQAWSGGLHDDEKRRFLRQWALSLGLKDSEDVLGALERGEDPPGSRKHGRKWLKEQLEVLKRQVAEIKHLIQTSGDKDLGELNKSLDAKSLQVENLSLLAEKNVDLLDSRRPVMSYISPFVSAEIRATIAASLSALHPTPSDSFPATKTNIILHCPTNGQDRLLKRIVSSVAGELGADVVLLNAQDLAEIAGDYLGDAPDPSPHSIRSLGYETYRLGADPDSDAFFDELGKDEFADEQENAPSSSSAFTPSLPPPGSRLPISILFSPNTISNALKALQMPVHEAPSSNEPQSPSQSQAETQLEDLKLANLLEHLIDATETKRNQESHLANTTTRQPLKANEQAEGTPKPDFFSFSMAPTSDDVHIDSALPSEATSRFSLSVNVGSSTRKPSAPPNAKIIYVPDFKELNATHYGGRIVQKLEEIVRKRRTAGESIMIIGSTSSRDLTPELSKTGVQGLQSEGEASFYRTIVVSVEKQGSTPNPIEPVTPMPSTLEVAKFRRINIRHIQHMLRSLDPIAAQHLSNRESSDSIHTSLSLASISSPSLQRILTYDEVHRIAVTALGLHLVDRSVEHLNGTHVALAVALLQVSDQVKYAYVKRIAEHGQSSDRALRRMKEEMEANVAAQPRNRTASALDRERQLQNVASTANKHEKRLMPGIANPDQIKTTFDQIHVPTDTIDSIRMLTSLSLLRPDAFNYGVLATEKISGALLYGPPGTGKTLLAKAVAKESGSTVLEVSGSQIMDKYVGEGEKNVTAIFSLARKLSPCIVFLDEADAIFSSRDVGRERTSHRDILNQFLKEWDGLNDLSVFVMVATNRPFDLDDAVIRRLPRRLLVDLPTQADRTEILKIHLRGEQLDASVDLEHIAKRTPFYSGSDLKNLAVSAALACVKEENEQAAIAAAKEASSSSAEPSSNPITKPPQLVRGQQYSFPEKRILYARHFDKALQEISASISENMSSLNAIKKFDEKYGDKKGKKTKHVFGIGVDKGTNENVVRVRT